MIVLAASCGLSAQAMLGSHSHVGENANHDEIGTNRTQLLDLCPGFALDDRLI
jgi:hypothetical protein